MGLDTSATHFIWILAIVFSAGSLADTLLVTGERLEDARAERIERVDAELGARLGSATFCYDSVLQLVNATAKNRGVEQNASRVELVADGIALAPPAVSVWGLASTSAWRKDENASFVRTGIATDPARLSLVTEHGLVMRASKQTCPALTTIVVTPSSVSREVGSIQDFDAQGYDQFGQAIPSLVYTWGTTTGTIVSLDDDTGRLTAGTTSGSFTVTATRGAVSGTASVTLTPGAPTSLTLTPDPVDVTAGETQQFTATLRDQHGNVNASAVPTYSTNAGSISVGGLLTAQTTTATGRRVTATYAALSDASTVNIVAGPVDHVTLTPSSATVLTNSVTVFAAVAYDQYDNVNSTTITWSATRGAVTAAGAYTAPATTGADTVTATAGGVPGTASVSVRKNVHVEAMATYHAGVADSTFGFTETVETRVTIKDHNATLVQSANVQIRITDTNSVVQYNATTATNAGGISFHNYTIPNGAKKGTWTVDVYLVSGTDLVYIATDNLVTSITFSVN